MAEETYDVVVIGSGPGGYVCAIRAAQLGLDVACVEKSETLGGTCLNVGCIPSKALLHASEEFAHTKKGLAKHGVMVERVNLDLGVMMSHKDGVVSQLTKGIDMLLAKNDVEHLQGTGRIAATGQVVVTDSGGSKKTVTAKNIVIATGSSPTSIPGVTIDEDRIVSSTGALELGDVPEHLVVIGGGYIGLELGSVWGRLGAKVTVVEFLDRITPGMDGEVAQQLQKLLKRQKMKFKLNTKVTGAEMNSAGVTLNTESVDGGDDATLEADVVLVAVGRRPHTEGLGLSETGINTNDHGFVTVDEHLETSVKGVYAIGDVVAGPMLAHKAEEEGVAVAERIAGGEPHVNYNAIPGVVYTAPEVAAVGKTEEQLQKDGVDYNVGKFAFMANGRAKAMSATEGFIKILACAKTDKVLGVHIIGRDAGTLIAEAVLAIEFGGSAEDIARTCHAHPTLNEAVKEAALDIAGRAIHM